MVDRNEAIERQLNDPENRFITWRQLDDGTYVAMVRLITTIGLCIGVDQTGYAQRYCFNDPTIAHAAYLMLKTGKDVPYGWIARRPETDEDREAKSKPGYEPSQFWPKEDNDD